MKVIASCKILGWTVNIYEIKDGNCVLAGVDDETPKWRVLCVGFGDDNGLFFYIGELMIPLDKCIRTNV